MKIGNLLIGVSAESDKLKKVKTNFLTIFENRKFKSHDIYIKFMSILRLESKRNAIMIISTRNGVIDKISILILFKGSLIFQE